MHMLNPAKAREGPRPRLWPAASRLLSIAFMLLLKRPRGCCGHSTPPI